MNAVEIEQAISELAEQQFDTAEFPYAFLTAFGNKETTIKRLRTGASNKSDIDGVLQTNNIHIKTCAAGEVAGTLNDLRSSPTTLRAKAKFILATDGIDLEAEDITTCETIACRYTDFPDHFGFFLPRLAGISDFPFLPSFNMGSNLDLNRMRPFTSMGYMHEFDNGASLSGDLRIGRAVYGKSPTVGIGTSYTLHF